MTPAEIQQRLESPEGARVDDPGDALTRVQSWPEIAWLALDAGARPGQTEMFERGRR
jgi:hypothetical protein